MAVALFANLAIVLLLVGGVAVFAIVFLRRRNEEGASPSRAGRIAVVFLAVLLVASFAFLVHALRQPRESLGEVEILVRCPGAELFVDGRHAGSGAAMFLSSDGTPIEAGVRLGRDEIAAIFPGAEIIDIRAGSPIGGDSGGSDFLVAVTSALLRTQDGTLDSVALVTTDTPASGPERRYFLLRARRGADRLLVPGPATITYFSESLEDRLQRVQTIPRVTLDLGFEPLPAVHLGGAKFIVDRYAVPPAER